MDWRELSIAPRPSGEAQTFRVTHPFHPLRGRTFQLVDCRQTWGEDRVYFYDDVGQLARLPLQWTDVLPDLTAVMARTSLFSAELDLLFVTVPHLGWTTAKVLVFKPQSSR